MLRRRLLAFLAQSAGLATLTGSISRVVAADSLPMPAGGRRWRIGWLLFSNDPKIVQRSIDAFSAGMRAKGWVLDEHYTLETRDSGGDAKRFDALAGELVALNPDVLIAIETTAQAFRKHTKSIPIVLWASLDPVATGLIRSLAKPGTNVTGISVQADALLGKNIEFLTEIVPHAKRIGLLYDPNWSGVERFLESARQVARGKKAEIEAHPITKDRGSVLVAFAKFEHRRPHGLVIMPHASIVSQAGDILEQVRRLRLVAAGYVEAGGLVQQSWNPQANLREAADFVDRIFRGTKPSELPVRQVMSFVVTVNARLAKEIGVGIPATLRLRADRVIE